MFMPTFFSSYEIRMTSTFYQNIISIISSYYAKKWKIKNKIFTRKKFYAKLY